MHRPAFFYNIDMRKALPLILVFLFVLSACGRNKQPEGILGRERMTVFLKEAYKLEAYYALESQYNYDSVSPEMFSSYDRILANCGVTKEQVEASFDYYSQHPEQFEAIQRDVLASLDSLLANGD